MSHQTPLVPSHSLALAVALVASLAAPVAAQPVRAVPPPALLVQQNDRSEPLGLKAVDVDARIVGHLAETRMTLTFHNPHDRALAGDLYVPLPEGATVSGYALDVDGVLVDGVVVDKHEARRVFEAEVRKGVDPGLVEWVGGNNFKTRVFPIPAHGTRTVRVDYVAEVDEGPDGARWRLPLNFRDPVGTFSLRVEVVKPDKAPTVVSGGPKGLSFAGWRDSFVAEAKAKGVALTDDLVVALPDVASKPVRVEKAPDGTVYFSIRHDVAVPPAAAPAPPKSVRLLWDASGSREGADRAREIGLVRAYLGSLGAGPLAVELVVFRDAAEPARGFSLPAQLDELVAALEAVPYDGGTQMAAIAPPKGAAPVDLQLLVTDGLSNFGAPDPGDMGAPVYVLNVSSTANHAFLRHLAQSSGGVYLNLARLTDEQALAAIGRPAFSFVRATVKSGKVDELYPRGGRPVQGPFVLAGRLEGDEATVVLEYGVGGKATVRETFSVRAADAGEGGVLRRDWAQKKVDALLVFPEKNADAVTAVGKAHGIVTPGTSLLVLERLDQYVEYRIRPPASLADMRAAYDTQVAQMAKEKEVERADKLETVLALWKARVEWWETKFEYPEGFRYGAKEEKKGRAEAADEEESGTLAEGMMEGGVGLGRGGGGGSDGAALIGARTSAGEPEPEAKEKADTGTEEDVSADAAVVLKAWDPQTPYIAALKAAQAVERYRVYLANRKEYGAAPAFFLDCSDFFRNNGEPALALRILSNLAELKLEDPPLLRVLAHRLAQLDHLDLSVQVFEGVLRLRPEEPQSFRDLALVLARRADGRADGRDTDRSQARADYERAMALLAEVAMGDWDRFSEIETIALMELNRIFPRAKKLGVEAAPVDPRLVKALPVDVRIVMTWDADMTDMDLHVLEPSTEEAYYGHNRTTIGGMVTRDFTQGYGPEVYLLKKGMHGTYTIRTKFYGSSAATLQGAVTLQVDVYTNYGRPDEKRQSLTFRLTETKEMFTVGEIEL